MEGLLTPLRTTSTPRDEEPFLTISKPSRPLQPSQLPATQIAPLASVTNLDDVLTVLRSKPSASILSHILDHLTPITPTFDIRTPSPKASQVLKTILEITIPDFWNVISKKERGRLSQCLCSVAGLGGIAARLRFLVKGAESQPGVKGQIEELLDLLQGIMGVKGFVHEIWVLGEGTGEARRGIIWKEFVTLVGGGKLLSVAAEAESVLGSGGRDRWVGDGKKFTAWLGREIAKAGSNTQIAEGGEGEFKALAILLSRAFSLGYSDNLVEALTYPHIRPPLSLSELHHLLCLLQSHDKRTYLTSLLRVLSRKHLSSADSPSEFDPKWWVEDVPKISQMAGLLNDIIGPNEDFRDLAVDWLVSPNGGGVGEPIGIRRALVCVLSKGEVVLKGLLEKSLGQFGDKIWIRHTPIMRQEVNVQLLLLSAGYVNRLVPQFLHRLARSSVFLSGVSNRLSTSSTRARFLGMIVGETLSEMTDKDGKPMKFGVEETETEEAKWWKSIRHVEDTVGTVEGLETMGREVVVRKRKKEPQPQTQTSKVMAIEEIEEDDDDEEQDELMPYPKPDSDAEDSDDDPTLINRKKDSAPIYIRDLILYLRSTDSYDRQLLALQSAASLIRRKATFGKEVSDHASELASLLTGLNDKFDMDDFQEMRMQALIALVVSFPQLVCGLLVRGFFEGDYSLGQRAGMVSAIGMGARELAGMEDNDLPLSEASGKGKTAADMFPSKKLLGKMHDTWGGAGRKAGPLDRITGSMEKLMIRPMAADAADKVTGPNVLKVRTFSSRIEVEKRRKKPVESKLGKVVGEAFFFPLTGRWWGALKDFGGQGIHFEPFLLTIFIKTLAIILHAAGPSAVALPQMTSELWDLLFSLRHHHSPTSTSTDSGVQEAVLFALLTLLEVNTENDGGRRLADEHAKELVETQEWVGGILESGALGEEEKGRVLAASVLMRINGIVQEYQRRLMGELLSLEA